MTLGLGILTLGLFIFTMELRGEVKSLKARLSGS